MADSLSSGKDEGGAHKFVSSLSLQVFGYEQLNEKLNGIKCVMKFKV